VKDHVSCLSITDGHAPLAVERRHLRYFRRGSVFRETAHAPKRLLKYWNGPRCCGFWRWPRREAQCRYPVRSRPSEQRRPTPKSTQPSTARGRRAAGCVARSLQPTAGMRLPRSLPSARLPLRATHPNISTGSESAARRSAGLDRCVSFVEVEGANDYNRRLRNKRV